MYCVLLSVKCIKLEITATVKSTLNQVSGFVVVCLAKR